jgi:hypothetical protein
VKDSEETPVGTTQLWPRPAVENVTVQLVAPHTGVGEAAADELVAKIAMPSTPAAENAAVATRATEKCNLCFTVSISNVGATYEEQWAA